ncbi:MAG: efflux RND transporter periplasmic adaptor subunit [Alphaproteobacteria bacterium]|nr:efflux RND transporter periplasmic adaptor subunit [Alphaproteobacteria bacterium]
MRKTRALLRATVAAAALIGLAGCGAHARDKDAATAAASTKPTLLTLTPAQLQHIQLVTVGSGLYQRSIETTGVVDFDNDQATSVLAPMSGPVDRLLVDAGQTVAAGQVLATVDSPDYASAVSAYQKADVTARNARRIADADRDLLAHNGVSAREAAQAQTDAASAEADRAAALQALIALKLPAKALAAIRNGQAGARIEGEIRSPIAGTVVEKLITPGQLLQAGTTAAFTVANLSRVWVMAQLTPDEAAAVRVGDPVDVETGVGAGRLSGRVDNISALVNPDTRSVQARVLVDNPGGLLKKQMYVRTIIRSRQPETGLLIPVPAVLRDEENLPFVYVQEPSGGFARRRVTLGHRDGDRYDIPEGLQAGDRIVADGALFLQFMQNQ